MPRHFKHSLSPRWNGVVLLLLMYFSTGEAHLCNLCSFTYTSTSTDYECVNNTEKVKTANVVNCLGERCQDKVVYKRHERHEFVVSSITRGCLDRSHSPNHVDCTESATEITCIYICKGEKCNNQDLSYKKPEKNGTTSAFIHNTIAFVIATILLLNLLFLN